eukprot:g9300.t1
MRATVQSLSRIRASQQRWALEPEQRRALKEQRSKARQELDWKAVKEFLDLHQFSDENDAATLQIWRHLCSSSLGRQRSFANQTGVKRHKHRAIEQLQVATVRPRRWRSLRPKRAGVDFFRQILTSVKDDQHQATGAV